MQHHVLPIQARLGSIAEIDLGVPPPIMKSFKEFLLSLDDSVDETEAVKRYNDYKLDFRRQQMQDFSWLIKMRSGSDRSTTPMRWGSGGRRPGGPAEPTEGVPVPHGDWLV